MLAIQYINITKFNYFTSNDIIHFLQGLLNYYSVQNDNKVVNIYNNKNDINDNSNNYTSNNKIINDYINELIINLCYIAEDTFLKWKLANVCQLVYLLTKFKHIHKNIF